MKFFQIISNFELDHKPEWLDGFRKKYDKPYPYHITFKQKTTVNESDILQLKDEFKNIINSHRAIQVEFEELIINQTNNGFVIMINASNNEQLIQLQKDILNELSKFGEVYKEEYKKYDDNFTPHITIGRRMDMNMFKHAKKELGNNTIASTAIDEVSLFLFENAEDDEGEVTTFNLKSDLRDH